MDRRKENAARSSRSHRTPTNFTATVGISSILEDPNIAAIRNMMSPMVSDRDLTISGRPLRPWTSDTPATTSGDLESTSTDPTGGSKWNKFRENEKRFGVQSSYNEHIHNETYTTVIDKEDPNYQPRMAEADKIAQEIENNPAINSHVAEERVSDNLDGSVSGASKYSNVPRDEQLSAEVDGTHSTNKFPTGEIIAETTAGPSQIELPKQFLGEIAEPSPPLTPMPLITQDTDIDIGREYVGFKYNTDGEIHLKEPEEYVPSPSDEAISIANSTTDVASPCSVPPVQETDDVKPVRLSWADMVEEDEVGSHVQVSEDVSSRKTEEIAEGDKRSCALATKLSHIEELEEQSLEVPRARSDTSSDLAAQSLLSLYNTDPSSSKAVSNTKNQLTGIEGDKLEKSSKEAAEPKSSNQLLKSQTRRASEAVITGNTGVSDMVIPPAWNKWLKAIDPDCTKRDAAWRASDKTSSSMLKSLLSETTPEMFLWAHVMQNLEEILKQPVYSEVELYIPDLLPKVFAEITEGVEDRNLLCSDLLKDPDMLMRQVDKAFDHVATDYKFGKPTDSESPKITTAQSMPQEDDNSHVSSAQVDGIGDHRQSEEVRPVKNVLGRIAALNDFTYHEFGSPMTSHTPTITTSSPQVAFPVWNPSSFIFGTIGEN